MSSLLSDQRQADHWVSEIAVPLLAKSPIPPPLSEPSKICMTRQESCQCMSDSSADLAPSRSDMAADFLSRPSLLNCTSMSSRSNFEFVPSDATSFLREKKAIELISQEQKVVSVWPSYKISALLNFLGSHHILSCPVIDDDDRMVDVISVVDVVNYIASIETEPSEGGASHDPEARRRQLETRTYAGFQIRDGTVGDVLDFVNRSEQAPSRPRPQIVDPQSSAFAILQLLTQGHHRVWMLDDRGRPRNVITQHDAFIYLHQTMLKDPQFQELLDTSLRGIGLKEKPVRTFPLDISLRFALGLLGLHGGALALVDTLGTVRAHFSPIDVKGLAVQHAPTMMQSAYRFLRTSSRASLEPLTVEMTDSLRIAAEKLFRFQVHHLWVVDRFSKPVAAFSLTDYLALVLHAACKPQQPEAVQQQGASRAALAEQQQQPYQQKMQQGQQGQQGQQQPMQQGQQGQQQQGMQQKQQQQQQQQQQGNQQRAK